MANIKVHDLLNLNLTGAELFNDSESFLKELSEDENQIFGGTACVPGTCQEVTPLCLRTTQIIVHALV
ncbi:hypothetical protein HCG51_00720 [Tolypothrix sp. PCC 7910]|uniref:hypothetical protein n=1 Tax=Tolypothrix sp. PCC 7910 TaxID=2099387 RepID=UPI001427932D|nr:hypothetical protein [Tolypothrix sp. PCC 7910]QIR35413.1 hypothetical protein HCG51_00720 [Tolypothrix sp. PCC 7910]